ncbi:hypothetical protein WJR50_19130 [Catalinimonas sp. 4WD22]|uniref:hypothetical protein n=1 Tax=Catalinimonas locisalis TaxID=3133978 RepID=UPI003101635F
MGQDKGLIRQNGLAWSKLLRQKLEKISLETCGSIYNQQKDAYTKVSWSKL